MRLPILGIIIPKMGRIEAPPAGLASALFARVQLRLLGLLFGEPNRTFHASELIRLARSGTGAVQRELKKLTAAGIVSMTISGNRKLYQANKKSPIFGELRNLILKTVGMMEPLRSSLKKYIPAIDIAFVYGSIASGKDTARSDIDLMIVGKDLAYSEIYAALQKAEKTLLRPVHANLMTRSEWNGKVADGAPFVSNLLKQPKLFVIGTENELKATR